VQNWFYPIELPIKIGYYIRYMYTKHTQQHKHRKEERQLSLVVASGY